jgi:hypothetical protein
MRHVKLLSADQLNTQFLTELIDAAYVDIKNRLGEKPQPQQQKQ